MAASVLLHLLLLGYLHESASTPVDCATLELKKGDTAYRTDSSLHPTVTARASGAKLIYNINVDATRKIAEVYAVVLSPGSRDDTKKTNPRFLNHATIDNDKLKWEKCSGETNYYLTQMHDLEETAISFDWTPKESEFTSSTLQAQVMAVVCVKDGSTNKLCSKIEKSTALTLTKSSGSQLPVDCNTLEFQKEASGYTQDSTISTTVTAESSGGKLTCNIKVNAKHEIAEVYAVVVSPGKIQGNAIANPKHITGTLSNAGKLAWKKCADKENFYLSSTEDLEKEEVSFEWTPADSEFGSSATIKAQVYGVICAKTGGTTKTCSMIAGSAVLTLTKSSGSQLPVDCNTLEFQKEASGYTQDSTISTTVTAGPSEGKLRCNIKVNAKHEIAEVYAVVVSTGKIQDNAIANPKHITGTVSNAGKLAWKKCSDKENSYLSSTEDLEKEEVSFDWTPADSEFPSSGTIEAEVYGVICVKDGGTSSKKCSKIAGSGAQSLTKGSGSPAIPVKCDDQEFTKTTAYAEDTGVSLLITANGSGKTIVGTVSTQKTTFSDIFVVVAKSVTGNSPSRVTDLLKGSFSSLAPEKGVSQDTCFPGSSNYLRNSIDLNVKSVGFSWKIDDSLVAGRSIDVQVFAFVCFADVGQQKKCSPIKASQPVTLSGEGVGPAPFNHRVRRRRRPRKSRGPAMAALVTVIALVAAVLVLGIPGGHFLVVAVALQ